MKQYNYLSLWKRVFEWLVTACREPHVKQEHPVYSKTYNTYYYVICENIASICKVSIPGRDSVRTVPPQWTIFPCPLRSAGTRTYDRNFNWFEIGFELNQTCTRVYMYICTHARTQRGGGVAYIHMGIHKCMICDTYHAYMYRTHRY